MNAESGRGTKGATVSNTGSYPMLATVGRAAKGSSLELHSVAFTPIAGGYAREVEIVETEFTAYSLSCSEGAEV